MAKISGYKRKRDQDFLNLVGANIRFYREKKGFTPYQLAKATDLGQITISQYENGKVEMNLTIIKLIAEHLGILPHVLLLKSKD
ncbi:helix-turn-helix domain-containing protein [Pedobacter sp. L105]|uniref:helix-turn-helix domain-containing protein n=1 Tax=Pedobacter sp. L105 TaxID=1641871 RepID=UPI00131ADAA8|nr:helix-turn-helix transcriptional regulator [Pedobacter sp. L105]